MWGTPPTPSRRDLLGTPPTPSRRDRRRAIEHYWHPSGEPLPGGPLPDSEWQAALSRFNVLEPYGATCYFSFFTEGIGWSYHRHNSETSKGECAAACLKTNGCTGFEFPENAEYCALWYRGNCDSGSSTQKGPVLGAPHLVAVTACPEAHAWRWVAHWGRLASSQRLLGCRAAATRDLPTRHTLSPFNEQAQARWASPRRP